ncbi:MAG: zinc-binding dehydrogenase [Anaerolineae bacterium]|nr:zinc-binding dehydrogenase [Anaerolineae bacterium]
MPPPSNGLSQIRLAVFFSGAFAVAGRNLSLRRFHSRGFCHHRSVLNRTRGAIFLTWAALSHYNTTPLELRARAATVLQSITDRHITIHIGQQLPLEQAAQAHRLMEQRETIGKIVLVP